jgi:hypothetical protein
MWPGDNGCLAGARFGPVWVGVASKLYPHATTAATTTTVLAPISCLATWPCTHSPGKAPARSPQAGLIF